jgi:hypothetical protein
MSVINFQMVQPKITHLCVIWDYIIHITKYIHMHTYLHTSSFLVTLSNWLWVFILCWTIIGQHPIFTRWPFVSYFPGPMLCYFSFLLHLLGGPSLKQFSECDLWTWVSSRSHEGIYKAKAIFIVFDVIYLPPNTHTKLTSALMITK